MSSINWLASYPKSGNTWLRIFLTNLIANADKPVDINDLHIKSIKDTIRDVESTLQLQGEHITHEELQRLRTEAYQQWARDAQEQMFIKMHDANILNADDTPIIPPEATSKVIYLARNPLDVAESFANHNNALVEQTVKNMGDSQFSITTKDDISGRSFEQSLLSWSEHVDSWLNDPELDVMLLRYEDLKTNPEEFFAKAVQFLELPYSDDDVAKAVEFSQFDRVKEQETEQGFRERLTQGGDFFRQGETNAWMGSLPDELVKQIIRDHGDMMQQLGYELPEMK